MATSDLQNKLTELLRLDSETEWVEFKCNNEKPEEIGEYLSAISNGAALHGKKFGYVVWGVEAGTHKVVGTGFKPKRRKIGGEELENWLLRLLTPRIDFTIHAFESGQLPVVLFEVQAANSTPVRFKQEAFIRVGSYKKKLKEFPEKERKLWTILSKAQVDWSAQIVEGADLDDLDPEAIQFARVQYQKKYPQQTSEFSGWDDATFLNKAKVCIAGKLTHTALLLLGKEESAHFLSPAQARITWVLRDENSIEKDYQHFTTPFILASDCLASTIFFVNDN